MRKKFFAYKEISKVNALIENFIKKYVEKFGKEGIVIGVSGGIDSAVLTKISVNALGKDKVSLVHVLERDTLKESTICAEKVAENVGLPLKKKRITLMLETFGIYHLQPFLGFIAPEKVKEKYAQKRKNELNKSGNLYLKHLLGKGDARFRKDIAYYETKARAITMTLYYFANIENKLVMDSGNKTELSIGYYARYGEAGDIMPLAGLYKSEVYTLAKYINVPEIIFNRYPAPDIIPGITDEMAIGMSYAILDKVLLSIENNKSDKEIIEETHISEEKLNFIRTVNSYAKLIENIPIKLKLNNEQI